MKKGFLKKGLMVLLSLTILAVFFYAQNNWLTVSSYTVTGKNLPDNFNGYKILHLSDLHDKQFGTRQQKLVERIVQLNPDVIVLTGDMVDKRRYNEQPLLNLLQGLANRYPIYMVPGNHELSSGNWPDLSQRLVNMGVVVLNNSNSPVLKGTQHLRLVGVNDPLYRDTQARMTEYLAVALQGVGKEDFTILLSHRPELFSLYARHNINLALSGHAHGGQVVLPILGAVFAPGQGLWPQYTHGSYQDGDSTLVVSRGLGNSVVPLRLFNRPELVLVELKAP